MELVRSAGQDAPGLVRWNAAGASDGRILASEPAPAPVAQRAKPVPTHGLSLDVIRRQTSSYPLIQPWPALYCQPLPVMLSVTSQATFSVAVTAVVEELYFVERSNMPSKTKTQLR